MVRELCPKPKRICEVGVGLGHFSRFVLDHLHPVEFVAIDTFELHTLPEIWGRPTREAFRNMAHRAFYEHEFRQHREHMRVLEGQSHECLATLPDATFDLIYIDAGHDYESVMRDAAAGVSKVKPEGLLLFNDYTLLDLHGNPYGVVQAVNELIVSSDWKVVGFSLQQYMFCDIALKRTPPPAKRRKFFGSFFQERTNLP